MPQDQYAGASQVVLTPGLRKTYIAVASGFTPYATPTDVITIPGNASNVVEVTRVIVEGIQTAAGLNLWKLIKRAAANTGGTSSALVAVPGDSQFPAAQSIPKRWTAAPTINSTVGTIAEKYLAAFPAASTVDVGDQTLYDVPLLEGPHVLRGIAEELALNFSGAAVPGGMVLSITVEWSEKPL